MATTRLYPYTDVELKERGARYVYEKLEETRPGGKLHSYCDGFGKSQFVDELLEKDEWTKQRWLRIKSGAERYVSTGLSVKDADGAFLCRPFLDVWQTVRWTDFDLSPWTVGGQEAWEEAEAPMGRDVLYTGDSVTKYAVSMRVSAPNGPPMLAESRFKLPRNPIFCVALARGEPHGDHQEDAYVAIEFGTTATTGYALVLPFREPAYLAQYHTQKQIEYYEDERGTYPATVTGDVWLKLPESEQSIRLPSAEGYSRGQRALIWIGVIGGKLVTSCDGFNTDVNIWGPESGESVWVHEGGLRVEGRGCEFQFSYFPCRMFGSRILSAEIPAGYATQLASGDIAELGLPSAAQWPLYDEQGGLIDADGNGTPLVSVDDVTPESGSAWTRQWDLTVRPRQFTSTFTDRNGSARELHHWLSPQVSQVVHGQRAKCTEAALAADSSLTEDGVASLRGEYGDGSEAGQFGLSVDNALGAQTGLGSRRLFELSVGWRVMADGQEQSALTRVFTGYGLEPVMGVRAASGTYMSVPLGDDMLRLAEMKVDGRVPAFDGWTVWGAIRWVLGRCGIPDAKIDIEDLGTVLPVKAREHLWKPEKGRLWLDVIADLCQYDFNACLWFEEDGAVVKGCRYCRSKRTNDDEALDSHVQKHRHWNDAGCQAVDATRGPSGVSREYYTRGSAAADPESGYGEILEYDRRWEQLTGHRFATWVEVSGKDVRQRPVTVVANCEKAVRDPNDPRFTGGWHVHAPPMNVDHVVTEGEAARIARWKLWELSQRPEFVRVRTPLDDGIRKGHVFQIKGAEDADLDGAKFRVTGVVYDLQRRPAGVALDSKLGAGAMAPRRDRHAERFGTTVVIGRRIA
jgi:hypothetical protein